MKIEWFRQIRKSTWVVIALYLVSLAWAWAHLLRMFNWYHFDLAGHALGGQMLLDSGLHGYQDRVFLGALQNLFYPPLEDLILATLRWLSPWTGLQIFPYYLGGVFAGFLLSQMSWVLTLRKAGARIWMAFGLLWLFQMQKFDSSRLQGWSVFDGVIIGLSSQFLSGIPFFQLLRLGFRDRTPLRNEVSFWTALCLLSHVVTGMLAGLLWLTLGWRARWKFRDWVMSGASVFLGTAFFLVPSLVYRDWVFSSTIYYDQSSGVLVLMGASWLFLWFRRSAGAIWVGWATLLYAPLILLPWIEQKVAWGIPFHFYRFAMPAWILFWAGWIQAWDACVSSEKRRIEVAIGLLLVTGVLVTQSLPWWQVAPEGMHLRDAAITEIQAPEEWMRPNSGGRTLVLGRTRACDFGLDYVLLNQFPGFSSVRGLHWEGSSGNAVISSFLATLFSPPVVLDYLLMPMEGCPALERVLAEALELFDIAYIVYGNEEMEAIPEAKRICWEAILRKGLSGRPWVSRGGFRFGKEQKIILGVAPDLHSRVVTFDPARVTSPTPVGKKPYFGEPVYQRMSAAIEGRIAHAVPLFPEDRPRFERERSLHPRAPSFAGRPPWIRLGAGSFRVELPGEGAWVHFRIHPQPGLKIRNAVGQELDYYRSYPGVVFFGSGPVTLQFERTPWMWGSYAMSFGFVLFMIGAGVFNRIHLNRKKKR
jgi:hypothetical protein